MSSNTTTNENIADYIYYKTYLLSKDINKIDKNKYNKNELERYIHLIKFNGTKICNSFYEVLYREIPVNLFFNIIIKKDTNFEINVFDIFINILKNNNFNIITISGYIKDIKIYVQLTKWCEKIKNNLNKKFIYDINYLNQYNIDKHKDKYTDYNKILNNDRLCNLHIVYFNSCINYSILNDFCKGNIILNEKYNNINNIIDKNCYKDGQKFELYSVKLSDYDYNYSYQLIQCYNKFVYENSYLDIFTNKPLEKINKTINKKTNKENNNKQNNKSNNHDDTVNYLFNNGNNNDDTTNYLFGCENNNTQQTQTNNNSNNTITQKTKLLSEEIIKLKQYIKELLNLVCKYKGFGNTYSEIMNYIPYNEQSMYGTTYFFDVYSELYNSIDHNTPEDINKIYHNKHNRGLCSCLTKIDNHIYYNYYDKTDNNLYYKYINKLNYVYRYYIKHYKYNNSKSSISKYNNKITELENKYNTINENKQNVHHRDIEDVKYSIDRKRSKKYKYYYSFKIIKKQDKNIYIKYNETNNILIRNYSTIYFDNIDKHIKEYYDKYLFKNVLDII